MPLETRSATDGRNVTLALRGELDISTLAALEQELRRLERNAARLVLDLRELQFIDSTGLRLVIDADRRARRDGRRLVIVCSPGPVQRVFAVTLLDRRLDIVDDPPTERGGSA